MLIPSLSYPYDLFSDNDCMENTSKIAISHKVPPFGISKNILELEKNKCIVHVRFEKYRFFHSEWTIDVCRGPIHIKKGADIIEVLKREGPCKKEEFQKTPFCLEWKKIRQVIQDDGLIFAEGEKENLGSDHGKVYCSYLLINKYLQEGMIFGRGEKLEENTLKKDALNSLEGDIVQVPKVNSSFAEGGNGATGSVAPSANDSGGVSKPSGDAGVPADSAKQAPIPEVLKF